MTNKIVDRTHSSIISTDSKKSEQSQEPLETYNGNNQKPLRLRRQNSIVAAQQLRQQQTTTKEEQRQQQQGKKYDDDNSNFLLKVPAIILAGMLNLMLAIPFGVSYFPIEWGSSPDHEFPLPGKESLGIRMFMFSTFVSQVIFTYTSSFPNGIGMQMVENVPFCHTLAYICIREQGYGIASLSTLFFLYGLASVLVGIVFYLLGHFKLGNIVYFFPSHVLIGCIGGIGIFVAKVGIEVSINSELTFEGLRGLFVDKIHLIGVVLMFEIILRILAYVASKVVADKKSNKLALFITPVFYLMLLACGVSLQHAHQLGFFFPPLDDSDLSTTSSPIWNKDLFDIWTIIDFSTISWVVVGKSIPTMISLIAFSLIHVPINIPAFSVSSGIDANMNDELKAHGYSNAIAGVFGGLQNYLCYSNSVLYYKTGGDGKVASLLVSFLTALCFFFGPIAASYIPRCMAGTLLLHVGIDLFKEGVYDSYGNFDTFEYISVWLITIIMSVLGMSAAIVTGVITALMTYVIQTIHYQNPIRGSMLASSLRSSQRNRPADANSILEDRKIGRRKIYVIQLQGHIFFGNAVQLTENIQDLIKEKMRSGDIPWIAIIDFTLVVGIDSSAAQTITKMRNAIHTKFGIKLIIFVTGSTAGFPCMYDLSSSLVNTTSDHPTTSTTNGNNDDLETAQQDGNDHETTALLYVKKQKEEFLKNGSSTLEGLSFDEEDRPLTAYPHNPRKSTPICSFNTFNESPTHFLFPDVIVCNSLDRALVLAEDALIALINPDLVGLDFSSSHDNNNNTTTTITDVNQEEKDIAFHLLLSKCHGEVEHNVKRLFILFEREVWMKDEIVWKENDSGDSMKLLVCGKLISIIDNDPDASEGIRAGAICGELGLVSKSDRLTTVKCVVDHTILYSLNKHVWDKMVKDDPALARIIDLIVVRYLAHRVQHVSNRIFETRCLPI